MEEPSKRDDREDKGKVTRPLVEFCFARSDTGALNKVIELLYEEVEKGDVEKVTALTKAIKDLAEARAALSRV